MKKVEMETNTDNQEYVDFSQNLCSWSIPKLKQLREATERNGTHPFSLHDYVYGQFCFNFIFEDEISLRTDSILNSRWLGILDEIIWTLETTLDIYEGKGPILRDPVEEKRIENGMKLFSKHFEDLWC